MFASAVRHQKYNRWTGNVCDDAVETRFEAVLRAEFRRRALDIWVFGGGGGGGVAGKGGALELHRRNRDRMEIGGVNWYTKTASAKSCLGLGALF